MTRREAIEKVKRSMKCVAKIESMDAMRRADQCFGIMQGAEIALSCDDAEFDEFAEFWEKLRAEIFGY